MSLPQPGPWVTTTSPVALKTYGFLNFEEEARLGGATEIELGVTGVPNHATLSAQVEKHEKVHAADIDRISAEVLRPWDAKLTEAQRTGRAFAAATIGEAQAKLYAHAGGTPDQIATRLNDLWGKASDDFHNTDRGKTRMDNGATGLNSTATRYICTWYLTI